MSTTFRRGGDVYAPPRNDAYIVLLIISLVAMILGCALLYMDYSSYPDTKAPTVNLRQAAPPAQTPPAGGGGAGGQQGGAAGQQGGGVQQQPPQNPPPPPDGGKKQ